jgi:hypothetical protein
MAKTRKQPVKRKYTKKAPKWTKEDHRNAIKNIEYIEPLTSSTKPKKELEELEFLDGVVLGGEQMLPEQKSRFMNYIYSRYWMYITLSKLTQ